MAAQPVEGELRRPAPARSLGVPRSSFAPANPLRIPIEDRPLLDLGGRLAIPPAIRASGVVPRVSLIQEYTDNVFFVSLDPEDDFVTALAPGVHYRKEEPRGRIELDYTLEAALYANHPELNDAVQGQSALVLGDLDLSDRTSAHLFDSFRQFLNPTESQIPGILVARVRTTQNFLSMSVAHRLTPLVTPRLGFDQLWQSYADSELVDSLTNEAFVGADMQTTRRSRLEAEVRVRSFDFERGDDTLSSSATVGGLYELSRTVVAEGRVGAAYLTAERRTEVVGGAAAHASTKHAVFTLGYERDITTSGGLGTVFLSQTAGGSARVRAGRGWSAQGGASYSRFAPVADDGLEFAVIEVRASLAYAWGPGYVLRLGYVHARQDITATEELPTITANRVTLAVIASF